MVELSNVGGKAKNLMELKKIKKIKVPNFFAISSDLSGDDLRKYIVSELSKVDSNKKLAVRSSALVEDGETASCAGVFDTYLDLNNDIEVIIEAVEKIRNAAENKSDYITEYSSLRGVDYVEGVGVVVQEMVENPDYSGVIFSHSLEENDGYFHLNFAKGLGEHIVSGEENGVQIKIYRESDDVKSKEYGFINDLIENVREIEKHYGSNSLDIEYAVKSGEVYILQTRPMTVYEKTKNANDNNIFIKDKIAKLNDMVQSIDNDVLGDMIDINPAELIGNNPEIINSSIFKDIFADEVVEKSRKLMGYEPKNIGLMKLVNNKPYISLKASAYSIRPRDVSEGTYSKMVNHYVSILNKNPYLQDRVEFDVFAMSCGKQLEKIISEMGDELSYIEREEIRIGFLKQDKRLAKYRDAFISQYKNNISKYSKQNDNDFVDILYNRKQLKKGTSFFVSAARLAFYQKNLLENKHGKEFVKKALGGLNTVSSALHYRMLDYAEGKMSKEEIVYQYGHLRLGQMDIFADSYKSDAEHYFNFSFYEKMTKEEIVAEKKQILENKKDYYQLYKTSSDEVKKEIDDLNFLMQTREEVKFEFAKAYDKLATNILLLAERKNISESVIANATIDEVLLLDKDRSEIVLDKIKSRISAKSSSRVKMPCVITKDTNFNVIETQANKPTYLSTEIVKSKAIYINEKNIGKISKKDIEGNIVVIDRADPGYDFVFSMKPKGLVTKVGGPASHMAIRALEHKIPACIGSGKDLKMLDGNNIVLDCRAGQIKNIKSKGR